MPTGDSTVTAKTTGTVPAGDSFGAFMGSLGLPSVASQQARADEFLKEYGASQAPYVQAAKDIQAKMRETADVMDKIQAPPPAKLEQLPSAPQPELKNPVQALGGLGAVIAMFGGLKTRAPLTSALNSAAAAMKSAHQGDLERAKQEETNWQNKFREALAQNQAEIQKYTEAFESTNFDINKVMSHWHALAAEFQNNTMLAATASKEPEMAYNLYKDSINAQLNAGKMFLQYKEVIAREAQTAATRQQTETFREQSREDRLQMFDAVHGTNLAGGGPAAKTGPTPEQKELIGDLDGLIKEVNDHPSVVGPVGELRNIWEGVQPALSEVTGVSSLMGAGGGAITPTVQNFRTKLSEVQAKLHKLLIGSGPMTKLKAAYINTIMRGMGRWDNPNAVKQSLQNARDMLSGGVGGTAREAGPQSVLDGKDASVYPGMIQESGGKKYYSNGSVWSEIAPSE